MITINAITTMNRLLQSLVGLTALALVGCKHTPVDYPTEDYDKLFPFRGVERPDGRYEDMTILSGNPETTPSTFVYPGVTLPGTPRLQRTCGSPSRRLAQAERSALTLCRSLCRSRQTTA